MGGAVRRAADVAVSAAVLVQSLALVGHVTTSRSENTALRSKMVRVVKDAPAFVETANRSWSGEPLRLQIAPTPPEPETTASLRNPRSGATTTGASKPLPLHLRINILLSSGCKTKRRLNRLDSMLEHARARLGEEAWERAYAEGTALDGAEPVELAMCAVRAM
jgi:hypothetical protein